MQYLNCLRRLPGNGVPSGPGYAGPASLWAGWCRLRHWCHRLHTAAMGCGPRDDLRNGRNDARTLDRAVRPAAGAHLRSRAGGLDADVTGATPAPRPVRARPPRGRGQPRCRVCGLRRRSRRSRSAARSSAISGATTPTGCSCAGSAGRCCGIAAAAGPAVAGRGGAGDREHDPHPRGPKLGRRPGPHAGDADACRGRAVPVERPGRRRSNICHGTLILARNLRRTTTSTAALLRYNGWVRGTNTPDCRRYPSRGRARRRRAARAAGRDHAGGAGGQVAAQAGPREPRAQE